MKKLYILLMVAIVLLSGCYNTSNDEIPVSIEYNGKTYKSDDTFIQGEFSSKHYKPSGDILDQQSGLLSGKEVYINIENDTIVYVKYDIEDPPKWIPYYKEG